MVMTNSDAHVPKDVDASFTESRALATACGLSFAGLRLSERSATGKVVLSYEASPVHPLGCAVSSKERSNGMPIHVQPAFV